MRKRVRHPEAARDAHEGRPIPPRVSRWLISLVNREPRRWAPRGSARTREEALERLAMGLAADAEGLYDGGWVKQVWE